MKLTVSDENSQFFRQIYTILGVESILKSELIYTISYRLNLPYKPTSLVKKIKEAIAQGILIEKKKMLQLSEKVREELKQEKKNYESSIKKIVKSSWNRIEDNIDPWMNVEEEKTKKLDKKSLSLNTIIRKIISKEILKEGYNIAASKFEIKIEDGILSGSIDDSNETNLNFKIDVEKKIISHNCMYFMKNLSKKKFCKHFYRIFMYVKKKDIDLAKTLLHSLYEQKENWKFIKP